MKVEIITSFVGETSIERGKTRVTEATAFVMIDDEPYEDVYFRTYTGQVMSAAVKHINFNPRIEKALSGWWYEVNFGDKSYEIGEEFTI